jgi:outer membrane protein assembly factor BamE (lipoprotein component of BamABCDE complex)
MKNSPYIYYNRSDFFIDLTSGKIKKSYMKILLSAVFLVSLVFFQIGCASIGNDYDTVKTEQVKVGMTRLQVEQIMGKPTSAYRDQSGNVCFVYQHFSSGVVGIGSKNKMLTIHFDSDNRVEDVLNNFDL